MKNKIIRLHSRQAFRLYSRQAGFTLVELLVVIVIIGILSTVAVVNLNSARDKARIASGLEWGTALIPAITMCESEDGTINSPMNATPAYVGGTSFCTPDVGVNWPPSMPNPSIYDYVDILDNISDGDTFWTIEISDSDANPLSSLTCSNIQGCYVP